MQLESERSAVFGMELTEHTKSLFLTMARWTKFLAILGFVLLGVFVIALCVAVLTQNGLSSSSGPERIGQIIGAGVVAILLASIYFYPTYALLMYSIKVKKAILAADQGDFDLSIKYLMNMFKYMGILLIIVLALYSVSLIILLLMAVK